MPGREWTLNGKSLTSGETGEKSLEGMVGQDNNSDETESGRMFWGKEKAP